MNIGMESVNNLPDILEVIKSLVNIIAVIIGGICALKGIGYLTTLQQKKAISTFSFGVQLYARLYELNVLTNNNELLFTNLFSESARDEWNDKRGAAEKELKQFYECVEETLRFIKKTPDQMPSYQNWVVDYMELIQFLVDVLHFDIRDGKNNFKFINKCTMDKRTEYYDWVHSLLNKLLNGIKNDQEKKVNELFGNENRI